MSVHVKLYYTDGSDHSANVLTYSHAPNFGRVYRFPCSISKLNLNSYNPTKEIYKYEIGVKHQDTSVLCEAKTIYVITRPLYLHQCAFVNKYGILENVILNSKSSLNLVTKKSISKLTSPVNYVKNQKQFTEILDESYNEIEATSGSITSEQALNFQQVLASTSFYEIVNNEYVPCIVLDDTFKIIPENNDIVQIEFKYRRAFDK
jgi:hypothetical protein